MEEYNIKNIKNTYFTIIILDSCGDIYDEIYGEDCTRTLIDCAKRIIEMKKEDIINLVEEGNGIEDKLEGLNGLTVEIIANVSFDEYNEENRLSPKRILSKYY